MSKYDELKSDILSKLNVDNVVDREQQVKKVILVSSGLCATAAIQPIPIADLPILTTIEIVMVLKIGTIYGFEISYDRAKEIATELAGVVGMGMLAQNAILLGYKTIIPFAGGLFSFPLVFGACYAIGRVADYYFSSKFEKKAFNKAMAKEIFKTAKKEGVKIGKEQSEKVSAEKNEIEVLKK